MLLVGGACSRSYTGFVFGVDKYAYDLPLVAWLFDEPQFASGTLMQSPLHLPLHLASGVLRGSLHRASPCSTPNSAPTDSSVRALQAMSECNLL
jgi:hypothetical protein